MSDRTYGTWYRDTSREAAMEEGHRPLWRHFIDIVPETDLSTRDVLDFGCNRGGFLRLLHALKPFRHGLGVDIAEDSVAAAQALKGLAPLDFAVATDLSPWRDSFDIAFSYEVVYLLPDLAAHAAGMHAALRPGGVYYAVTGCHTAMPLWPAWRELIGGITQAPVQDRSPEDYAAAFAGAGFDVSVRRFGYDGFVPAGKRSDYYPTLQDALAYPAEHKLLFRMVRREAA
ncbi:class I SAM-dependent methyltransferase [Roseomonas gilardii]|uniref:Class I SAM-dependent methyltransferase n=1 Tax=Roseomonas gilardii TaxID=257708 RepID=A0ABU3MHY6_9PROT|nr:class I SAM-dependent methyltransferase [Roseomonas gilardii]MDT8332148.1 class I SAM-dependent methyltransferase [Roseomonas gilardii]